MSIASLVASGAIRQGAAGDAVKAIQLALRARGYPLTGTGWFGPQTDTAVEDYQRRNGLLPTGIVDVSTAVLLDRPLIATPAPSVPLWLAVSLSNLGLKEAPGAANNRELVADIKSVAPDYQSDATPWCAGWVSFCLSKAGEKPSSLPLWALSYSDTKKQPFVRLAGPAVGAIAVKTRNGGGHVTFVAGRTRSGALACCGGNQNDEVNVSPYLEGVFMGFFWPKGATLPVLTGLGNLPIVTAAGKPVTSEA